MNVGKLGRDTFSKSKTRRYRILKSIIMRQKRVSVEDFINFWFQYFIKLIEYVNIIK